MSRIPYGLLILALASPVAATTDCSFTNDSFAQIMWLDGDCSTDAEQFFVPDGWTLDGNGYTITATGGFKGAVITNGGAVAHVTNVNVTAYGLPCQCHPNSPVDLRVRGVLFQGASGSVTDVSVVDLKQAGNCGCQEGNGIEVRNEPFDGTGTNPVQVSIANCEVARYQKNGITCNGNAVCAIANNSVAGLGPVSFIAQNGIQFGYAADGHASQNAVDGNWYTGLNWASTGILVYETSTVHVQNNSVTANQGGVTVESVYGNVQNASDNVLLNNQVLESQWGIIVDAWAFDGWSLGDAHSDRNRVQGNTVKNTTLTGDIGIFIGAGDYSEEYAAFVCDNLVRKNVTSGFADAEDITPVCPESSPFTLTATTRARATQAHAEPFVP